MKILRTANDPKPGPRGVCLAIGFFDGVHLGHQQIIRQTIADARQHNARAVVVTFDSESFMASGTVMYGSVPVAPLLTGLSAQQEYISIP